jgi:hypothetical protein
MTDPSNPPPGGRINSLIIAVKGLTFTNILMIALLMIIMVPVYIFYKALNDPAVMDRLLSSYSELSSPSGCLIREFKPRAGKKLWTVSTGFAYQGSDRWLASVVLDHQPEDEEIESYCASLKLITDSWRNINEAAP